MLFFNVKAFTLISSLILGLVKVDFVAAQCSKPSTGPLTVLSDADAEKDSFPEGSLVNFKCIDGYIRNSGSRTINCTAGEWSELTLQCEKKPCGNPGDVPNGRFEYTTGGVVLGDTVTAVCNKGFQIGGQTQTRTCQVGGWDGGVIICEAVRCSMPPGIENGKLEDIVEESYEFGMSVSYTCLEDFTLIGSQTISCTETGDWTEQPKCVDITCEKTQVVDGQRIGGGPGPYKHRSFIDFECNEGFIMEGESHIVCELEGWTPDPPKCVVVTCGPPPTIQNGRLTEPIQESYIYDGSVSYTCDTDFILSGSPSIVCSGKGDWSSPPVCVALPPTTPKPTTTSVKPTTTAAPVKPPTKPPTKPPGPGSNAVKIGVPLGVLSLLALNILLCLVMSCDLLLP